MIDFLKALKPVRQKRNIRIVFVCTANCCRSPLAEILFEKIVDEHYPSHWLQIESAATQYSGLPIATQSAQVLVQEENISPYRCSQHVGRHLSEIKPPDLILTMTSHHKQEILRKFPKWQEFTFTLEEFVYRDGGKKGTDIADPMGGSYQQFIYMKEQIKQALLRLYNECREAGLFDEE